MIRSIIQISARFHRNPLISTIPSLLINHQQSSILYTTNITHKQLYSFAKLSKKQKDKQKSDQQKKKVKQQIGDTSTFDLNPIQQKYQQIIDNYKNTISHYKVGRLDPSLFQGIYVKIGHNSLPIQQLAQIAPKSLSSVVLNPFDQDTLDMIQKTIQTSDMGFQVTKVDKTILVSQPPNSMKQIKQKMLQKLKKNTQNYKQKLGKVRTDAREDLKKYKKIIPQERYKVIQKQLNTLYDKFVVTYDKVTKDKQTQLKK